MSALDGLDDNAAQDFQGAALGGMSQSPLSGSESFMPTKQEVIAKRNLLDQAMQRLSQAQAYRQPGFDVDSASYAAGMMSPGLTSPYAKGFENMLSNHMKEIQRAQTSDIASADTLKNAAQLQTGFNQQDIENAQRAAYYQSLQGRMTIPVHLPNGTTVLVNKLTGETVGGPAGGGSQNPIPDKALNIFKENSLSTPIPALDKTDVAANADEYKKAVAADDGAREAAASVQKILPALNNYQAGTGSTLMAGANAMLPEDMQSEALQNTQKINKISGTLASQLAASLKNARIGIGMEQFVKSTTIDPNNAPDVNRWIANNITDLSHVTRTQKDMEAFLRQFPSEYKEAIKNKFFDENPIMVTPQGSDIAKVNPSYQDAQFFRKWLNTQAQEGDLPKAPGGQSPQQMPQQQAQPQKQETKLNELPPGAVLIGKDKKTGKNVYQLPDGSKVRED